MSQEMGMLYYGQGCPHCQIVEDYLSGNGLGDNVSLQKKEVFHNRENLEELKRKANSAGIPDEFVGVPLLCEGDNCLVGEEEIINFFEQHKH
ncbi:hypothetical protein NB640_02265 [Oxalobacter vibrioformis]|uniref:Glutaredoxin n=1 Tax=Oxalobacter vibrioformis TaxID=933080 RepID=A0A9E9LX59_9BURK|nr:hypothetical protein [Oxalobacter vibrioformis]NLC23851.1 hypothetical protein [Oxalobacter sp.]WAW10504.1 hypothetical protein NB640_02265 [Oxalobacter vibrioformis]